MKYVVPKSALVMAVAMIVGGCANNTLPPAMMQGAIVDSNGNYIYRIGVGDVISVFVWDNPDVSGDYTVRPDGKISMALTEAIPASGLTTEMLAEHMTEILKDYINNPKVTVIVKQASGSMSEQVKLIGDAVTPRALPFKQGMTLLDLMIQVGGLSPYADGNNATLIRIQDGDKKLYRVRIEDLMDDADLDANVDLMPGDVVKISEAWF
ncbi:XrtA/PEP-CTERM system exopolysaccharide export protein [Alteromonas sp. 14N.309.X.WAT.G.H12]|uniref:XrtA/PEP-CTERM system exopolysaccharide export protein n=1 Tax=Alteromonas sp. 14N.309.X.WAT.G.H12 TaxID=3120824 RepID=UPI002FD01741